MAGEYDLITNFDNLFSRGGSPAFNAAFADIPAPSLSSALTGPVTPITSSALTGTNGWNQPMDFSGFDASKISDLSGLSDVAAKTPGGTVGGAAGTADPNRGLGFNIPTLQLGFGALNSIGNLYAAFQSNALAKKQFNFQKNAYNQNLTNSIQSYNTALADRARSRAVMEGQTDAQRDAYVSENSLKKI